MKKKFVALIPIVALLTSCPIVNPIYPQDELDLSKYREPIFLNWANDDSEQENDILFEDGEELRSYLNTSRSVVKEVTSFINVYRGKKALRIDKGRGEIKGELIIDLKNIFRADAIALHVYPYYYSLIDRITGKTGNIYDAFSLSINERESIAINQNDEDDPQMLTFCFNEPIEVITIQASTGRGFLFGLDIYQKI
ncbi:MAG: hypothetical protein GX812_01085 [Erysipelotrichaceae bacterium]|jgi:hypothetical protein|nr:hypothetical protein [Bacilli bacterium]NLB39941.1 hypothetical protein [Erysipelotrichaceae bacterium]HNY75094.1 hypothetical protein [Bacilli bacterium]